MLHKLKNHWSRPAGFREVLVIAIPLILSTGAHGLKTFTDRTFLTWYDSNAISASMLAGMVAFTVMSLFQGVVGYVNTFVAQYTGAKRHDRVGHAVGQGVYLALLAGMVMLLLIPFADYFFALVGHSPQIQQYESAYFKIICISATPALVSIAISCFFTGRGRTRLVMYITLTGTALNIILDYIMIFGKFGCPRLGIVGAAWATVLSATLQMTLFLYFYLAPVYRHKYSTLKGIKPDRLLFARMIRFGLPNGLHFFLSMICWTLFFGLSGKVSETAMSATAVAMQINSLSFMPMFGFAMAVSTLVGQRLGSDQPHLAQRSTWSAFAMTGTYMTTLAVGYIAVPDLFIFPFSSNADPEQFNRIIPIIRTILLFVSVHAICNTANMMFSSALKGAGDTRFVMISSVSLGYLLMAIPAWIAVRAGAGIYTLWALSTLYMLTIACVYFTRFILGKWKTMRVIESAPNAPPANAPSLPVDDIELPYPTDDTTDNPHEESHPQPVSKAQQ
ncbi:Multidrug-efflux transporter [Anaerohalosphaera lusitana]|uniref:Multidrug-efflux transporter n=1 Tax=Anaerohalosphaera lusitana TaxID=1936003 RepID=A0A1U9NJU7_9BACT|nr:MATE family efflux transporter [Anaerohalosphaera lusitana]AQT68018.1 Multidrug-efflux transporter [Anaerohalosphaera lusitana]